MDRGTIYRGEAVRKKRSGEEDRRRFYVQDVTKDKARERAQDRLGAAFRILWLKPVRPDEDVPELL